MAVFRNAKEYQLIDADTADMLGGVMQFSQTQVRDAMIPRPQMVVIDGDLSTQEALPKVIEAGHSRYPVTGEDRDEIVGVLLAKDLLKYSLPDSTPSTQVRQLVRPATFIPESKRLNVLLKEFRFNRNHMAIVVDEYGGVCGLITIEDVLEEIVGEIADEYDIEEEPLIKTTARKNEFIVKALTPLTEFDEYFQTDFQQFEDIDTIGGLVLKKLGRLPRRGESILLNSFKLTVIEASKRDIQTLLVKKI
ncbi:MAG: CBS domain-containing protein [Proteobacteria bacterium]|nr:CBS domain-containing protein [Pseudomonadota bacterium]